MMRELKLLKEDGFIQKMEIELLFYTNKNLRSIRRFLFYIRNVVKFV